VFHSFMIMFGQTSVTKLLRTIRAKCSRYGAAAGSSGSDVYNPVPAGDAISASVPAGGYTAWRRLLINDANQRANPPKNVVAEIHRRPFPSADFLRPSCGAFYCSWNRINTWVYPDA